MARPLVQRDSLGIRPPAPIGAAVRAAAHAHSLSITDYVSWALAQHFDMLDALNFDPNPTPAQELPMSA